MILIIVMQITHICAHEIYPPLFNLYIFLCGLPQLVSEVVSVSFQTPVLLQQRLFLPTLSVQLQLGFKVILLCLC